MFRSSGGLEIIKFFVRSEIEEAARDSRQLADDLAGMLARLEDGDDEEVEVAVLEENSEVEEALKDMIAR